jgi:hypothetical protein
VAETLGVLPLAVAAALDWGRDGVAGAAKSVCLYNA